MQSTEGGLGLGLVTLGGLPLVPSAHPCASSPSFCMRGRYGNLWQVLFFCFWPLVADVMPVFPPLIYNSIQFNNILTA